YLNTDNKLIALVYNSSDKSESVTFVVDVHREKSFTVAAKSFSTITLN
ncbi:MAG: hypothetical protein FJ352_04385, partial [Firmicutes bacterium]|nr:hypothetical protein [Bacillota bacterium]